MASTFASAITVFLLASRLEIRSSILIAALLGLPLEFVAALINKAERGRLFNSEEFGNLTRAVHSDPENMKRSDEAIFGVMDLFWYKHVSDDDPQVLMAKWPPLFCFGLSA